MRRSLSFLLLAILIPAVSLAQSTLRGKVLDAISQQPLAGVMIKSGPEGAISGLDGSFEIQANFSDNQQLTFSYPGYQETKLSNYSGEFLVVSLPPNEYQMEKVVLSAWQSGKSLMKQSGSISVLGPRELQRDNQTLIAPALNRVPGVYMHSGALNTNRITMRGIGARSLFSTAKIRAYLNEIPLTTGDGETTLEDIDMSLIDRVEVIKGPTSSQYGAGLGGTIQLLTDRPQFDRTDLRTTFTSGSYGLFRNVTQFSTQSGNSSLQLNVNSTHSDGYRENNEYDRTSVAALGQVYAGDKASLSVFVNFISQKAFIPSSIDSATFAEEPQSAAFTWQKTRGFEDYDRLLTGLSYDYSFNENWGLTVSGFSSFRNAYEPRPFNILRENSQTLGLRFNLAYHNQDISSPFTIQFGGEGFNEWYYWLTYENINGEGMLGGAISDNQEVRMYGNLFTQAEWALPWGAQIEAGLNLNRTRYTYTDRFAPDSMDLSGDYTYDLAISPRIGYVQPLNPKVNAHASISHGFSPPTLSETLTPDGLINPDIQPETGWNYEAGIRGRLAKDRLFFDFTVYTMQVRNLLVARRTDSDAFVGVNAGKTDHTGFELALDYQFIQEEGLQADFFTTYTYAHYRFAEFVDEGVDFAGNQLTGTPPHLLNAGIDVNAKSGVYGNLNFQFVDGFPMRDDNTVYSDAYSLVNLKLGWRGSFSNRLTFDISGGVNNILQEKYASMILINAGSFGGRAPRYYYPGLPRNFYGTVSLGYQFR